MPDEKKTAGRNRYQIFAVTYDRFETRFNFLDDHYRLMKIRNRISLIDSTDNFKLSN